MRTLSECDGVTEGKCMFQIRERRPRVVKDILLKDENTPTDADCDYVQTDSDTSPQVNLEKGSPKPYELWAVDESHQETRLNWTLRFMQSLPADRPPHHPGS